MSRAANMTAKKPALDIERTHTYLETLGLGHALSAMESTLSDAVPESTTVQASLDTLLKAESDEQ